jgi:hypothetical protein
VVTKSKSLIVRPGTPLALPMAEATAAVAFGSALMREILAGDVVERLVDAGHFAAVGKKTGTIGHGIAAKFLARAKPVHGRLLPQIARARAAYRLLLEVECPIGLEITQAQATALLCYLFAAKAGGKRTSEQSAAKLAACVGIFSPSNNALSAALGLWKPVSRHPLVLALAINTLMAERTFEPSEPELREVMSKAEKVLSTKFMYLGELLKKVTQADKILFEFDRVAWDAAYASVGADVITAMMWDDASDSPRLQALEALHTAAASRATTEDQADE